MNRGWRFCRPLPYHLATAPIGTTNCAAASAQLRRAGPKPAGRRPGEFRPRLVTRSTAYPKEGRSTHTQILAPSTFERPERSRRRSAGVVEGRQAGCRAPADQRLERETGFEPATSTLARSHSTTELFPLTQTRTRRNRTACRASAEHQSCQPTATGSQQERSPYVHSTERSISLSVRRPVSAMAISNSVLSIVITEATPSAPWAARP